MVREEADGESALNELLRGRKNDAEASLGRPRGSWGAEPGVRGGGRGLVLVAKGRRSEEGDNERDGAVSGVSGRDADDDDETADEKDDDGCEDTANKRFGLRSSWTIVGSNGTEGTSWAAFEGEKRRKEGDWGRAAGTRPSVACVEESGEGATACMAGVQLPKSDDKRPTLASSGGGAGAEDNFLALAARFFNDRLFLREPSMNGKEAGCRRRSRGQLLSACR